ncbi:MAG: ABC transporter permease [Cyanobacteriota bacterium]|nr:ABC transporter permease [Cyanobacteriota bacterium]
MSSLKKWMQSKQSAIILPTITTLILFILWEIIVRLFSIPNFILPAPSAVIVALFSSGQILIKHALQTLMTTVVGFVLALALGLLLGFWIGFSKIAYAILYPLLVGFNTIPKVALVPLMALWFGVGAVPAILTAFLLAFFPIAVNVAVGLDTVEPEMRDVLKSLGASPWEIFVKVGLPHSMPYLFASLKIAISSAFIGSVISETVASNGGLGFVILTASSQFEVALAFSGLLVLSAMGVILYSFFATLERYIIHWAR